MSGSKDDELDANDLLRVDQNGSLLCNLCDEVIESADVSKDDEKDLPGAIKAHFAFKHNRDVEVDFEL
jgi:hypothetical protein